MTPLKFDILAMIRDPDDYTSNERAAGAAAVKELVEASSRVIYAFEAYGKASCLVANARCRQECEAAMVAQKAALSTIRSAS